MGKRQVKKNSSSMVQRAKQIKVQARLNAEYAKKEQIRAAQQVRSIYRLFI